MRILPSIKDGAGQSMSKKGFGADRPLVRRKRSWGWEGTERLYGAVGEKSIDFLKILYRLFWKTL